MDRFMLWVAEGFGIGKIPFAPGTFGSVLGLIWAGTLASLGNAWIYGVGCVAGVALSICFCGHAETLLHRKDPSSVVLDEIAALPVCFASWFWVAHGQTGEWPDLKYFVNRPNWAGIIGIFALFRFFDVAKPWPVRQSQSLPGGWGVTIDDVLAAIYVNFVWLIGLGLSRRILH